MTTRSALALAMLLCGCVHHAPLAPEPARGPARDSLFELDRSRGARMASARGRAELLALLAPNVVYLRAGAPAVYGIDGVRALLEANPLPVNAGESWLPLGGGVSNDLRAAYTYGIAARGDPAAVASAAAASAGGGDSIRFERYIAYWERTNASTWQIAAYAEIGGPLAGEPRLTTAETTPPATRLPPARAETATRIRAADSLFSDVAYRLGLAYAFSDAAAPTGAVFGAPALVIGPDAMREHYAAVSESMSLTWHPVYADAAASRDLGFTVGEYVATLRGPSGAAVQRFGKYLTVWQRQKNGKKGEMWKFVIDGGNGTR